MSADGGIVQDDEYDWHEAFLHTEKVVVREFAGDKDEGLLSHSDCDQQICGSHGGCEVPSGTEE